MTFESLLEMSADGTDRSELMNELLTVSKLLRGIMKKHSLETPSGDFRSFQYEASSDLLVASQYLHRILGRIVVGHDVPATLDG